MLTEADLQQQTTATTAAAATTTIATDTGIPIVMPTLRLPASSTDFITTVQFPVTQTKQMPNAIIYLLKS